MLNYTWGRPGWRRRRRRRRGWHRATRATVHARAWVSHHRRGRRRSREAIVVPEVYGQGCAIDPASSPGIVGRGLRAAPHNGLLLLLLLLLSLLLLLLLVPLLLRRGVVNVIPYPHLLGTRHRCMWVHLLNRHVLHVLLLLHMHRLDRRSRTRRWQRRRRRLRPGRCPRVSFRVELPLSLPLSVRRLLGATVAATPTAVAATTAAPSTALRLCARRLHSLRW